MRDPMTSPRDVQGKILFHFVPDRLQYWLQRCELRLNDEEMEWTPQVDFPSALDTIAFGKNIVLKHLVEVGRAELMEHVVWWIKGDEDYYCPQCLNVLISEEPRTAAAQAPSDRLFLHCGRCQANVQIPENAFSVSSP